MKAARLQKPSAHVPEEPSREPRVEALLTVREVAQMLRLTETGIYNLVAARRIPHLHVSNRLRFDRADVLAFIAQNRVPASERER